MVNGSHHSCYRKSHPHTDTCSFAQSASKALRRACRLPFNRSAHAAWRQPTWWRLARRLNRSKVANSITARLNGQLQRMRRATQHHQMCCNTITLAFLSENNALLLTKDPAGPTAGFVIASTSPGCGRLKRLLRQVITIIIFAAHAVPAFEVVQRAMSRTSSTLTFCCCCSGVVCAIGCTQAATHNDSHEPLCTTCRRVLRPLTSAVSSHIFTPLWMWLAPLRNTFTSCLIGLALWRCSWRSKVRVRRMRLL